MIFWPFCSPHFQFPVLYMRELMNSLDNAPQTNYLSKARDGKMPLVQGDYEVFGNVLSLIDDYEG